jgi:hypothetical protein
MERTVQLDPVPLAATHGSAWRQEARKRVVAAYFPPEEQVALYGLYGCPLSFNPQADFYAFYGIFASSNVR